MHLTTWLSTLTRIASTQSFRNVKVKLLHWVSGGHASPAKYTCGHDAPERASHRTHKQKNLLNVCLRNKCSQQVQRKVCQRLAWCTTCRPVAHGVSMLNLLLLYFSNVAGQLWLRQLGRWQLTELSLYPCSPKVVCNAEVRELMWLHWYYWMWQQQQMEFCCTDINKFQAKAPNDFSVSFYPRDAMLARVIAIATCPSVHPSVTSRYCVKTKKASGMISSPPGSPKTLVFWRQISSPNSKGFPPNGGLKEG